MQLSSSTCASVSADCQENKYAHTASRLQINLFPMSFFNVINPLCTVPIVGYCASSGGFTTVDVDLYCDRKLFQIGLVCIGVVSQQTLINIVISRY